MEIDRTSFNWELPGILDAISEAHCVSIDLEFSGIANRKNLRSRRGPEYGSKQTLQQRYTDIKEAAEKYKILQVGLTCIKEDPKKKRYLFRSYNFYANPILKEKLDVDRDFSFSSEAMDFLLSWGFSMDKLFKDGVPYLSRVEEAQLRRAESIRRDKTQEDLLIDDDDQDSKDFIEHVRLEVDTWKRLTHSDRDFLNISSRSKDKGEMDVRKRLNAYQRRLVHQLVRAEYPEFVAFSPEPEFIQIKLYNKEREDAVARLKQDSFDRRIHQQNGLRWIFEAMVDGDLSYVDVASFAKPDPANPHWIDISKERADFQVLQEKLKSKRTVLIGHNMFMDLVYLYHTYFGPLPTAVEDFVQLVHELFPLLIDTKFLATRNNDASNAKSGLEVLDQHFTQQPVPEIEMMAGHDHYFDAKANHQAAYDSLLTAKVFLRMSAFLEAEGDYVDVSDQMRHTLMKNPDALARSLMTRKSEEARARREAQNPQPLPQPPIKVYGAGKSKNRRKSKAKKSVKFSSPSMFDALSGLIEEPSHNTSPNINGHSHTASSSSIAVGASNWTLPKDTLCTSVPSAFTKKQLPQLLPAWNEDFWRVYGNKVRMNGTIEGVCDFSLARPTNGVAQQCDGTSGYVLHHEM